MYVSMSDLHPLYEYWSDDVSEINLYLIRKIHNKTVYYLIAYDIELNEARWTRNFQKAHHFIIKDQANDFLHLHLPTRDCDILELEATWVI